MTALILLSCVLFIATNIDDLILLIGFYADRSMYRSSILCGQYLGILLLLLGSIVCSEIAFVVPPLYIRLLGLLPLAIGFGKLPGLFRTNSKAVDKGTQPTSSASHVLGVAALTVANGGDNVGVYLPFFATHPPRAWLVIVAVFVVMTALWCAFADWLAHHKVLQEPIQRWGSRLLPFVLIALGIHILFPGR